MITISDIQSVHDPLTDEVVGIEFNFYKGVEINLCEIHNPIHDKQRGFYCTDQDFLEGARVGHFPAKSTPPAWNLKPIQSEPVVCEYDAIGHEITQIIDQLLLTKKTTYSPLEETLMNEIQEHKRELQEAQSRIEHIKTQIEQKRDQLFELRKGIGDPPIPIARKIAIGFHRR